MCRRNRKLAVNGDTSVINDAVSKAENYFGGYSDFERIAQELNYGGSDNGVGDVSVQQNGYSPVVLSENQAQNYTPKANSTVNEQLSKSGSQIVVGTKTLEQIRNDFPILNEKINGHPLVWLDNGATTFWETLNGSAENGGIGSLCHGWSALPVYYYHKFFADKGQ